VPRLGSGIFWAGVFGAVSPVADHRRHLEYGLMAGEQIMRVTNWNAWVHANQSVGSTAQYPLNRIAPGVAITLLRQRW